MFKAIMGATFRIIKRRVGAGAITYGKEVMRVQQLLRLAGFLNTPYYTDGPWDHITAQAWLDFQKAALPNQPTTPYVDPQNYQYGQCPLTTLALKAKVLIPMPIAYGRSGAVKEFFNHCNTSKYKYGWVKGDRKSIRLIWGFEGRPRWAIATDIDKFFPEKDPVMLNCTSFTNLMMSIWMTGRCHQLPYDASQQSGNSTVLSSRYQMKALDDGKMMIDGYCYDLETIRRMTRPEKLYHFTSCNNNGDITHDMVLLNGEVYECNVPPNDPAVFKTPLERRFNAMLEAKGAKQRVPRIFGEL